MTPVANSPLYEPDRAARKVMGPIFGVACLLATSTGVVVLALLLGSVVSNFLQGKKGADVQLIASAKDEADLPGLGEDLIVVAALPRGLHFRIFDAKGTQQLPTSTREGLATSSRRSMPSSESSEGSGRPAD